jgi:zinc protease
VNADFRKDSKENRWLSNLTRSYTNGNSPEDVLKFEEMVNAVTARIFRTLQNNILLKIKLLEC